MSVCDEYSKEGEASELRGVFQAPNGQENVHIWYIGGIDGQLARGYSFVSKVFKCRCDVVEDVRHPHRNR